MQILIFVTDDGRSPEGTGPTLFVKADASATIPVHPRGLNWRYFATVGIEDAMVAAERLQIEAAIGQGRPYISQRLIFAPAN